MAKFIPAALVAGIIAIASACSSGPSEDDPAYVFHETRWVDPVQDIELRLEDGEAEFITHRTDKKFDLTYTVDADGLLLLSDESQELFKQDVPFQKLGKSLESPFLGLRFQLMEEGDEEALAERVAQHKQQLEARTANRPTDPNGYTKIAADEWAMVLASRMQDQISEENLAEVFIEGYSSNMDAFAKRDLLAREMPKLKAELARYASTQDYQLSFLGDGDLVGQVPTAQETDVVVGSPAYIWEFDFNANAFPFSDGNSPCALSDNMQHHGRERGISYAFRIWGHKDQSFCQLQVDDALARRIEEARDANMLTTRTTLFFRLTGEKDGQGNLIVDTHSVNVELFERGGHRN